jgi:hypothetical protein
MALKFIPKPVEGPNSNWQTGFNVALGISLIVTSTSILQVTYAFGYLKGQEDYLSLVMERSSLNVYTNFDYTYWLIVKHICVTLCLIISSTGLWLRKNLGLFLSALALAGVCGVYIWWYIDTLAFVRNSEASEYTKLNDPFFSSIGSLLGATWWDKILLVIVLLLFLWNTLTLVKVFKAGGSISKSQS